MGELRFKEIAEKVMAGELSQQQGADALGMPRSTFMFRMNKEYPNRPKGVNVRNENRAPVSGRPRKLTYMERVYTDETLCRDLACRHCPFNTDGGKCKGPKGLIEAMLRRVPLKADGNILEET